MSVEAPTPPFEIVPRPDGKLHDLPVAVRWEATRRHPYYLTLWEDARRYHQGKSDDPPELRLHAYAATLVLAAIGVTGEPVDPATPFSEVSGPDCDPTFLAGSVQPMTFRSVAMMLLGTLRAADLAAVGALFVRAGSEEYHAGHGPDVDNGRTAALNELIRMPSSALDSVPDAPLFYVHLGASQRSITEDMRDQVRHRKERRGIGTSKVHGPKLGQYIEVWDLREGWTGDGYDAPRELSFKAVAQQLKRSLSTVVSQYRSAFELVVGGEFKPELWWQVMGPLKFAGLFGPAAAAYMSGSRHRLRSPVPRPVPDSVLSPVTDAARTNSTVERLSAVADNSEFKDLLIDFEDMVERGLNDEQIAGRLGFVDIGHATRMRSYCKELRLLNS